MAVVKRFKVPPNCNSLLILFQLAVLNLSTIRSQVVRSYFARDPYAFRALEMHKNSKILINTMYKKIPVKKLSGDETFINTGNKKFSILEFWRYGFSNLNSNVLRGALAEFIIENAIRQNSEIDTRNPWGDSDVITPNGKKIEVKCCSYIQDWDQNNLSRIVWSGLRAKELYYSDAVKKLSEIKSTDYKSDIYILSLLKHKDPSTLNILDMNQWCFWVLSKDKIKEITKNGNSISLTKLEKLNIESVSFKDIPIKLS